MITLVRPSRGHVTQVYGNIQPDGNPHAGQDYAYTNGVEIFPEVYAAADGVVLFSGDSRGLSWPNIMYLNIDFDRTDNVDTSAGNYTIIAHYDASGRQVALTGYGHQEDVWVNAGDKVKAGQRIGTVGATGFSAGKHLHFDLVLSPFDVDDAPFYGRVDPNPYFTGSLSYQGTTITPTPSEEDELSKAAEEDISRTRQILEDWEKRGMIARVIATDERTALLVSDIAYVKSAAGDTLYERNDGDNTLRPIGLTEWEATGKPYVTYSKERFQELYGREA